MELQRQIQGCEGFKSIQEIKDNSIVVYIQPYEI
nr:MAG TPA: hypothetical protein [Bacteriophage sp.]